MNADLRPVSASALVTSDIPWPADALAFASRSDPLLAAYLGDVLLGFMGFHPASLLSDSAYAWVQLTTAGRAHPQAIGRLARRWRGVVHSRYPQVFAHCTTSAAHQAWLRFIGAKVIDTPAPGLLQYTIEA